MKKKRVKKKNGIAKALQNPVFRQRVKPHKRPKDRDWMDSGGWE